MKYYVVKFKEMYDTDKGPKWRTDRFLIQAVSITDAEAKLNTFMKQYPTDFEVVSVSESAITKVVE